MASVRDEPELGDLQLFSTYQLGKLWRKSPATIRRWIRNGHLKASRPKFGAGRYYVTGKEIKRFIRQEITNRRKQWIPPA